MLYTILSAQYYTLTHLAHSETMRGRYFFTLEMSFLSLPN